MYPSYLLRMRLVWTIRLFSLNTLLLLGLLSGPAALAQVRRGYHWTSTSQPTNQSGEAEFTAVAVARGSNAQYVGGNNYAATVLAGTALPAAPAFAENTLLYENDVPKRGSAAFVAKRTDAGAWQWVRPVGNATCNAVVTKVVASNAINQLGGERLFVIGSLRGSFTFGSTTLDCSTDWGAFIACLDPSGNWLWATKAHFDDGVSETHTLGQALALHIGPSSLDLYAAGSFNGRAIFGNSFANLTTPYRHRNTFIAKLDGLTGAWRWVRQAGSTTGPIGLPSNNLAGHPYASWLTPADLAVDPSGNPAFCANFGTYATARGATQPTAGPYSWSNDDQFLVSKLDAAGNWLWSRSAGPQVTFYNFSHSRAMAAAPDGGFVLSGFADYRPVTFGTLPPVGGDGRDFLVRLSAAGAYEWAGSPFAFVNPASTYGGPQITALDIDPSGTIWAGATGRAYNNVNPPFVFGAFGRQFTPSGLSDAFFGTLTAAGQPLNGQLLSGSGLETCRDLTYTNSADALIVGSFTSGNIPFTSPTLVNSIVGGTTPLPFIARSRVAVPVLTSITPMAGATGALLTLNGTDFYNVEQVLIGGMPAVFTVVSPTQLTATVPATLPNGPAQVAVVTATDPGIPTPVYYTVLAAPASVTFSPGFGSVGAPVTLRGTGFTGATLVKFGGTTTTNFLIVSDQEISVRVPSMGLGSVKISVVNPAGTGISAANFGVGIAPVISTITPTRGAAGSTFSISGAALGGATSVKIGAVPCVILSNTATTITARVPNTITGAVNVTTPYGTAFGPFFTPTAPAPTITLFAPASGPMGTSVNIAGTNLDWVTGAAVSGVAATITAQTPTSLTLTVPDAATGRITLTGPGGTATSAVDFVVPTPPAPAWAWAQKTTGLGSYHNATGVTTDLQGNTYVVGDFALQATFGAHTIASQGTSDAYVAKQAPNGTWLWAVRLGGYGNDAAYAVSVLPGGRLVVVGYFEQTMTVGSTSVESAGEADAFAAFLNLDGTGRTVYRGGSARYDAATALCTQPDGTAWVAGEAASNVGSGTAVAFGPGAFSTQGSGSAFVTRLTEAAGFTGVGSVNIVGAGNIRATGVAVSPGGKLVVAGRRSGSLKLGPANSYSSHPGTGGYDSFVALTSTASVVQDQWNYPMGFASTTDDEAAAVAFDGEDIVVAGKFTGELRDPGRNTTLLTSAGGSDGYLIRITAVNSPLPNTYSLTRRLGGTGNDEIRALAVDAAGNATITGSYEGTTTFGPTALTAQTGAGAARDLYVARLSAAGQWNWATSAGTNGQYDEGRALTLDAAEVLAPGTGWSVFMAGNLTPDFVGDLPRAMCCARA